jgi:hypothetical protein
MIVAKFFFVAAVQLVRMTCLLPRAIADSRRWRKREQVRNLLEAERREQMSRSVPRATGTQMVHNQS